MEFLTDEEVKASERADVSDQSMEYIVHFTKAVKLYQLKSRSCFRCWSPEHTYVGLSKRH